MENTRTRNRKAIVSIVTALMMALAMMPGMAFAGTQTAPGDKAAVVATADTVTITNIPATMKAGQQAQLEATYTAENPSVHVEWSSSNADVATVAKTRGVLNAVGAGTATIIVKLVDDATGSELASDSAAVRVEPATEYGFQGEGGNTLKLTNPSDISVEGEGELNGLTLYQNIINTPVTAADGVISFGYTMSAGINNFQQATFNTYKNDINIYDPDGNPVQTVQFGGFSNRTVTITFDAAALEAGSDYILRFGPSVRGNNENKTLGCYIDFQFTYE